MRFSFLDDIPRDQQLRASVPAGHFEISIFDILLSAAIELKGKKIKHNCVTRQLQEYRYLCLRMKSLCTVPSYLFYSDLLYNMGNYFLDI